MNSASNNQTAGREAQDSSVRSVNLNDRFPVSRRQQTKARRIARKAGIYPAPILSALAAFGGRITRVELPAQ